GADHPTFIIAEIGTNHGGSLERAKGLINACAEAGADAVKFQSWTAELLNNVKEVGTDGRLMDSKAIPILRKYELPNEWHVELAAYCNSLNIHFLSTPFDLKHARLLRDIGVPAIKISSSDLVYDELLEEISTYSLPVLLSVGMANLGEIEHALECLGPARDRTVLLHCIAAYPPIYKDVNLRAIHTLRKAFGLPVGFSDHLPGHEMVLAATALGACVIEKHVTFSREDDTPDSFFALTVNELALMVQAVRRLEAAMGDGQKRCMPSEKEGLTGGRRCIFAARDLKAGMTLTRDDLAVVRPNIGEIKPRHLKMLIGRILRVDVSQGAPLAWRHLDW
ncbi:MAG: N-acetylneuraminate synthase family protein, partial [Dissulfurimicrobium sp.]